MAAVLAVAQFVHGCRAVLASAPSRRAASTFTPLTPAPPASSSPWPGQLALRGRRVPFSALICSCALRNAVVSSAAGALSAAAASLTVLSRPTAGRPARPRRDGLDAAHAGGHAAFGHDLEQADVAGAATGAAAQLGWSRSRHAHHLAVLLADSIIAPVCTRSRCPSAAPR